MKIILLDVNTNKEVILIETKLYPGDAVPIKLIVVCPEDSCIYHGNTEGFTFLRIEETDYAVSSSDETERVRLQSRNLPVQIRGGVSKGEDIFGGKSGGTIWSTLAGFFPGRKSSKSGSSVLDED